jgi:hypothetical protein
MGATFLSPIALSSHRLVAVAVCFLFVPTTGAARAQVAGGDRPGHFVNGNRTSIDALRSGCLTLGDDTFVETVPRLGACRPLGVVALGKAGGRSWFSALFERRWLLSDSSAPPDTVTEGEFVLFVAGPMSASRRDTVTIPVWHYRFEAEMLRSVTADVASTNDGGALFAIQECLNGTGGCGQSFFTHRRDRWHDVATPFLDSLVHRFPNAILHGFHVDVRTLKADAAVYGPHDANCCPSRDARLQLRLQRDSLQIVSLEVSALRSPDA